MKAREPPEPLRVWRVASGRCLHRASPLSWDRTVLPCNGSLSRIDGLFLICEEVFLRVWRGPEGRGVRLYEERNVCLDDLRPSGVKRLVYLTGPERLIALRDLRLPDVLLGMS